ncbi:hypothetical protein B0T20DRAFT_453845 [Sordaria brevicollis]|uniref:Uncharacterized protein n=1 Tax=Sordaria brevicollis TaxID=83679 RepID=A0AAE0PD53_SORBR|nr:hypothetical protein B0T20DRAFT_453845 [Sordaria brevicollis]
MGIAFSTLAGWAVLICAGGLYWYSEQQREAKKVRKSSQRHKLEEKQQEPRKEPKEKAKKQRTETPSKPAEEPEKTQKPKQKAAKAKAAPAPKAAPKTAPKAAPAPTTSKPVSYSSDEDDSIDNREFARQFANIKQGTVLNTTKKQDEKRQKSVKQSRALERDVQPEPQQAAPKGVSAPSSTAGVDADDDESSVASPEVKAKDAGDVSDMLEPTTAGPSVLRLTDTDKVKQKKAKKEKPMEKVETKKQRQNRKKAEAEKAAREEAEKARQVLLEKQRREARIAEGRAAKDGSAFMAAQAAASSAWTGNGAKSSSSSDSGAENNGFVSVEPLDTFSSKTPAAAAPAKAPEAKKPETWVSSIPTEEEQMQLLRDEEAWNTVQTKKSKSKKNKASATDSANESESAVAKPQEVASAPVSTRPQAVNGNKSSKIVYQQSSFAALSPKEEEDEPELVETEKPRGLGEESSVCILTS